MNKSFQNDYYRMRGVTWSAKSWLDLLLHYDLRYLWHLRKKSSILHSLFSLRYAQKYGLEILTTNIGDGLYLGHAHNINVNPGVVMGKNCNLHKGCTVGKENRGKRKGAPVIGNQVWIGSNSTVCGAIHIGDDVLIAPNSYVNFDVPDHSIVFGNPAVIKHRDIATEYYINNLVE